MGEYEKNYEKLRSGVKKTTSAIVPADAVCSSYDSL